MEEFNQTQKNPAPPSSLQLTPLRITKVPRTPASRSSSLWPAALLCMILWSSDLSAGHRKAHAAPIPIPSEAPALATTQASGDGFAALLFLTLVLIAVAAFLVWLLSKMKDRHLAELLPLEEKVLKLEENALEMGTEKSQLKLDVLSIRTFADKRLAELSLAEQRVKLLETQLATLLDANPGAWERATAKAKKDLDAKAAQAREQERRAHVKQGGAGVKALLDEMKRGS
jgi:hypothetical protein